MIAWGDALQDLYLLEQRGFEVRALKERPEVHPLLHPVWRAWNTLHRHRSVGMSINPIAIADIAGYLDIMGFTDTEVRVQWLELISALEDEYLAEYRLSEKNRDART